MNLFIWVLGIFSGGFSSSDFKDGTQSCYRILLWRIFDVESATDQHDQKQHRYGCIQGCASWCSPRSHFFDYQDVPAQDNAHEQYLHSRVCQMKRRSGVGVLLAWEGYLRAWSRKVLFQVLKKALSKSWKSLTMNVKTVCHGSSAPIRVPFLLSLYSCPLSHF